MFVQVNGLYINHDINTISHNEYCDYEQRETLKEVRSQNFL